MKLEPKHLAPYLPYGLKILSRYNEVSEIDRINLSLDGHSRSSFNLRISQKPSMFRGDNLATIKPILFPLSSITKEITINGESFVPYNFISKNIRKGVDIYFLAGEINIDIETDDYSQTINLFDGYEIMQKLIEWKFDVFGLIEAGLAEPVTEDFNPYK